AFGVVVEVVHLGRAQGHGDPGCVQANALGPAAQHQYGPTGARGQGAGHGAPGIGEVVTGRCDPQRGDLVGYRDERVVGEGHSEGVGDHTAPITAGGTEPVSGQGGASGG